MTLDEAIKALSPVAQAILELKEKQDEIDGLDESIRALRGKQAAEQQKLNQLLQQQQAAVERTNEAYKVFETAKKQTKAEEAYTAQVQADRPKLIADAKAEAAEQANAVMQEKQQAVNELLRQIDERNTELQQIIAEIGVAKDTLAAVNRDLAAVRARVVG